MTWTDIAQLGTMVALLLTSIVSAWLAIQNARGIKQIHTATNSMKDALVATTAREKYAEGVKDEKERTEH